MFNLIICFICFSILVLSYFIGSLNFSILISKFYIKKEIRNLGSKNAGTTNMLRMFGKKFAALTFLGDFLKGAICIFIVNLIIPKYFKANIDTSIVFTNFKTEFQMIALFGVALGHIFPIFFSFKGGKGIATTAGAIALVNYKIFIVLILFFLLVLIITKMVSLSSILTTIFFAIFNATYWFIYYKIDTVDISTISIKVWLLITTKSTILSFIILIKHSENIKRIFNKTEPKIGR